MTRLHLEALEDRTLLSVDLLNVFGGLNSGDDNRYEPPDTDAAAGPDFVVETVNASVAFYEKSTGNRVFFETLQSFFAPIDPSSFVFDPVATYDEMAGRFVVAALDGIQSYSRLNFAVSDTSNPLDGFTEMHQIDLLETDPMGNTLYGDYPKIGFNADAYVIAVNMLEPSEDPDPVQVVTFDKSSVLDRDPTTLTKYQVDRLDSAIFTMAGATMHGSAPGDPMYFVTESTRFGGDSLRVVQMTNVLSDSPTFTDYDVPVPPYDAPPPAIHPGGTIQTFESFILNADWRNGRLVATHHVGSGDVARARWYEFDTGGGTLALIQSGEINQGPGVYTYFSSIAVASNGDIGMTFMESSASEFVSMYVTGRKASDAPGTMQTPVVTFQGQDRYEGTRGGDYSAVTVDPVDETFWAANMYKVYFWGTGIANFSISNNGAPPVSTPGKTEANAGSSAARLRGVGGSPVFSLNDTDLVTAVAASLLVLRNRFSTTTAITESLPTGLSVVLPHSWDGPVPSVRPAGVDPAVRRRVLRDGDTPRRSLTPKSPDPLTRPYRLQGLSFLGDQRQ